MSLGRDLRRGVIRPGAAIAAVLALVAALGGTATAASSSSTRAADTKAWCNAVISVNTKYGTMKNKRYLPVDKVPLSAWKGVIDSAVAGRSRWLAITPASIKTAVTHELAWFAHVKANHYNLGGTPTAPYTAADAKKITGFQAKYCGIKYS